LEIDGPEQHAGLIETMFPSINHDEDFAPIPFFVDN
jgi:hypothetical protein